MMGFYLPTGSADIHHLQHIAEVQPTRKRTRLQSKKCKKYKHRVSIVDELHTTLSAARSGLAASGNDLLSTVIAVPIAISIEAVSIFCGLFSAYPARAASKGKKHNEILAKSKLNTIADRGSANLNDDKISEEDFHLKLSEMINTSETENWSGSRKSGKRQWPQPELSSWKS